MTPETYRRVRELVEAAADKMAQERAEFLKGACGEDVELRRYVELALAEENEDTGPGGPGRPGEVEIKPQPIAVALAGLAAQSAGIEQAHTLIGKRIGRYHIKSVINAGGMGTVYEAVQDQPHRVVALKVMRQGIASRSALRRFEYESQILGRLRHPGIAQVYEADTHRDDAGTVPYFAMEYIPGARAILDYAAQHAPPLGIRQRLDLFAKVCDAVHHGHTKGIVHRDLKPTNILVDPSGQPKIIDFGVARSTDSDLAVTTLQTDIGELVGTAAYMSPEQCRADPHDLDTRSDVYSLGVVLYELLCGRGPYDADSTSVLSVTRAIVESSPRKLSTINPGLRGDVETIVLKALEKDRSRRYQSALELAQDIRRYLAGEVIQARRPSLPYQLRLLARRNKPAAAGVAVLILGLAVSAVVAGWTALTTEAQVNRLKEAKKAVDRARSFDVAAAAIFANDVSQARNILDAVPERDRPWEWRFLDRQADLADETIVIGEPIRDLAANRDGTRVVFATGGRAAVRTLRADRNDEVRLDVAVEPQASPIQCVAWSRDDAWIAVSCGSDVYVFDGTTLSSRRALPPALSPPSNPGVVALEFSPTYPALLAVALSERKNSAVVIYNAESGALLARAGGLDDFPQRLAWSGDGRRLAATTHEGRSVYVFDLESPSGPLRRAAILRGHTWNVNSVAFSDDGRMIASGDGDKTIVLWDVERSIREQSTTGDHLGSGARSGVIIDRLYGHDGTVDGLAFNQDHTLLASASLDTTVRFWTLNPRRPIWATGWDESDVTIAENKPLAVLRGHRAGVAKILFNARSNRFITGSRDGDIRVWLPDPVDPVPSLAGHYTSVQGVAYFGEHSEWLASADDNPFVLLWDARACEGIGFIPVTKGGRSVAAYRDLIAVVDAGRVVLYRVRDPLTPQRLSGAGEEIAPDPLDSAASPVHALAFSPDGSHLAAGDVHGVVHIWDITEAGLRSPGRLLHTGNGPVQSLAFSSDGALLATATVIGRAQADHGYLDAVAVWDASAASGAPIWRREFTGSQYPAVAFRPNKDELASTFEGNSLRIWNASSGTPLVDLRGHGQPVVSLAFHPVEARLASGSDDSIRIWDLEARTEVAVLRANAGAGHGLAFSRDGSTLVSAMSGHLGAGNTIKVWESDVSKGVRKERAHIDAVHRRAELLFKPLYVKKTALPAILDALRAAKWQEGDLAIALRYAEFMNRHSD